MRRFRTGDRDLAFSRGSFGLLAETGSTRDFLLSSERDALVEIVETEFSEDEEEKERRLLFLEGSGLVAGD